MGVSKILAPISSNPNFKNLSLSSSKMAISPQSITALLAAPITNNTNNAEPSSANDESAEFDVDAIFPDFNKDNKTDEGNKDNEQNKEEKKKKKKRRNSNQIENKKQNQNQIETKSNDSNIEFDENELD